MGQIETICRDCVFAEWDGIKQTQCKFDRLEKFVEQDVPVTEVCIEDGQSYFLIPGRYCNTCRDKESLDGIPARKWKEHVRKEVIPTVTMAIYVDEECNFDEVKASLESIINQTIKPAEILVIYNINGEDAPSAYVNWFLDNAGDIPWRIENIKGAVGVNGDVEAATYGHSVDLAIKSNAMKSRFFVVAKADYEYPADYIEVIDQAINDELERFVALVPDKNGNGLFVQTGLHKLLQGNKEAGGCKTVLEKIESIAREEGNLHMIKRFEDLRT